MAVIYEDHSVGPDPPACCTKLDNNTFWNLSLFWNHSNRFSIIRSLNLFTQQRDPFLQRI